MRTRALIALTAVAFASLWPAVHPALPQLPNGDVFTSLGVARHLAAGDGFLNDTVYPLFTAYPWGRTLPQPLLHRPPGLAVLLLPAWWLAEGDPVRAEQLVQPVMVVVIGLIVLVGLLGLRRQGHLAGGGAWLLLLLFNPLLALAVSWGWGEVPGALLLLGLWRLNRNRPPAGQSVGRTVAFAAICAALAMVRSDLLWAPVMWWAAAAVGDPRRRYLASLRRTLLAALVGLVLIAPWYVRVASYSGAPLSNPLVDAVQLDLAEEWWDYPLLRSRTPIPLTENLAAHPVAALHKTAVGIKSYLRTLGLWLPWLAWLTGGVLWTVQTRRRLRRHQPVWRAIGPVGWLGLTLGLMMVQYGFFSHETRHMLPLLPVLAFEGVALADGRLRRTVRSRWRRAAALTLAAWLMLQLTRPGLGGEAGNVMTARELAPRVDAVTAALADLPPGPVFSDNAAVPWRLGRACVWSPYDATIEQEIRRAVPGMADAPWVRIMDLP
ncbi:MAG: hypothetical protein R3D98_07265 [Candidatus Krumholzibacteriia bacterium]